MAGLWLMVRKDLARTRRTPMATLALLSFPVLFAAMLGLAFGGGSVSIPKVRLLVADNDGAIGGQLLTGALAADQIAQYFDVTTVDDAEGRARMEAGAASALLVVPAGFTDDLLAGRPTSLELVRNPAETILPEVAEQAGLVLAEVLSAGSRVLREPLDRINAMIDEEQGPGEQQVADVAVAVQRQIEAAEEFLFPPVVTLDAVQLEDPDDEPQSGVSVFGFVLPGISVFALFMLSDQAMRDILTEKTSGTLRRQLSGPVGGGRIVVAKAVYTGTIAAGSLVVLSLIGWLAADLTAEPLAFIVLGFSVVLMVTGATSVMYGLARSERQGSTIGTALFLFFAFIGGSFFQVDGLPGVLAAISPYTPFRWANDGFRALLLDGAGLPAILPQVGLLAGSGAVALFLGGRLLQRRMLQGGA